MPGVTAFPGLRKSPRSRTCVARGFSRSCSTSCDAPSGCSRSIDSIQAFALLHSGTVVRQ